MSEHSGVDDQRFMNVALALARDALAAGEFPVGCVIVAGDRVVGSGRRLNSLGAEVNEIDHAEIVALRAFSSGLSVADEVDLSLYCTLEPCLMCFGAILLSPVKRVVYAYEDVMGGGTGCDLAGMTPLYRERHLAVIPGVLRQESLGLFKTFFSDPSNDYWRGSRLASYTLNQL